MVRRFKYLISYTCKDSKGMAGIGKAVVTTKKPLRTIKQLDKAEQQLLEREGLELVAITSFQQINLR
ncbi:hypothetical protein [Petroclostridium sp. X23]|uniref:hypothetical protein n=1 Tax=Petroclostridium sp. X23 TaxID=3045146 RepID=UPI0024AD8E5F|nr:hypothetical protein [Petroclostridium sp. X23]WHH59150.1 hypothetical protein QKW49_25750 [Petroclostridium sp. X23]